MGVSECAGLGCVLAALAVPRHGPGAVGDPLLDGLVEPDELRVPEGTRILDLLAGKLQERFVCHHSRLDLSSGTWLFLLKQARCVRTRRRGMFNILRRGCSGAHTPVRV